MSEGKLVAGDSVECIDPKGALQKGEIYTIQRINDSERLHVDGIKQHFWHNRFRRVSVGEFEEKAKEVDFEEIQEAVCEFCEDHNEISSNRCEGSGPCSEMMEMYLEDNNLTIKKETKVMEISEHIFNTFDKADMKDVQRRFGSQYGTSDRDLLAMKRDKKDLLEIIKKEKDEAKAKAKSA